MSRVRGKIFITFQELKDRVEEFAKIILASKESLSYRTLC
jgi:hypothetical protein